MKRIVLTGPESTGKTTLAEQLAKHYSSIHVAEFAREFLNILDRPYEQPDLLSIAKGQIDADRSAQLRLRIKTNAKYSSRFRTKSIAQDILICDTDLRTIRLWSMVKYGSCHDWIEKQLTEATVDLYLLCRPDLEWQPDPLREVQSPEEWKMLYEAYKTDLERDAQPFVEIGGTGRIRFEAAIRAINRL